MLIDYKDSCARRIKLLTIENDLLLHIV